MKADSKITCSPCGPFQGGKYGRDMFPATSLLHSYRLHCAMASRETA